MSHYWYIVNTLSGYESKVAKTIRDEAIKRGVSDAFEDIVIPTENVSEFKKGKKVDSVKKIFPGYILVKMDLNDTTWSLVKQVPNVAKFLGVGNRPARIAENEVKRVLQQVADGMIVKECQASYEMAEVVKIIDGPFETFAGVVEDVDQERKRLKVLVSIFGRDTPVELEFKQVEKIK